MTKFSLFENTITIIKPTKTIDLNDLRDLIISNRYKQQVEEIRALKHDDFNELKKLRNKKKLFLHSVIVAGDFKTKDKDLSIEEKLIKQSGYASIDIDNISNLNEIRDFLINDPFIHLLFYSPSGNGIKAVIKVPLGINDFTSYVKGFYQYIGNKYNIEYTNLDTKTADITRVTYLSYDKDCYYNKNAIEWKTKEKVKTSNSYEYTEQKQEKTKQNKQKYHYKTSFDDYDFKKDIYKINKYVKMLEYIKADEYYTWLDVLIALKDYGIKNSIDLFPLFDKWSSKSENYDNTIETLKKWDSFDTEAERFKKITYKTIYFHAVKNGYKEIKEETQSTVENEKKIKEDVSKIKIWNAVDLFNSDIKPPEMLIKHMLIENGVTIIGGDSGAGKSFFAQYITLHLLDGKSLFSSNEWEPNFRLSIDKPKKVLYFDEENNIASVKDRLKQLSKSHQIKKIKNLNLSILQNILIDNEFDALRFLEIIKNIRPDVIILDSLVRFFTGDENSSNDIKKVFNTMKEAIKLYNVSFLFLHHTGKPVRNQGLVKHSLRGSSDISAFADIIVMIDKKFTGDIYVTQKKNRHEECYRDFYFNINKDNDCFSLNYAGEKTVATEKIQDEMETEMIKYIQEEEITGFKTSVMMKRFTGHSKNDVYDVLRKLVKLKIIEKEKKGHYKVIG